MIVGGVGVSGFNGFNPNDFAQYSSAVINNVTYETFSMATTSCNLGDGPLSWIDENSSALHPVISQNFFRLKNVNGSRRFEHLAQSWLKHGFCALRENYCCTTCTAFGADCDYLGVGCSDPYTGMRNGGQINAGPKFQVNATTGVHIQPKANPPGATSSSVSRRMHIPVTELEVSNGSGDVNATRYFGECMYVHPEDAVSGNKNNNASYRAVSVSGGGATWTFVPVGGTVDTTQRMLPGIRAWADTDTTASIPDVITRVVETDVVTPEDNSMTALVLLAAQATKLGNGLWHFEYAIENLNSDRSIASYAVPVGYANVVNIGFRDVAYWDGDGYNSSAGSPVTYDGTDWPGVWGQGAVTWQVVPATPVENSNALRWGTLYNFRFDCDVGPAFNQGDVSLADVSLVQFKPGAQTLTALSIRPADVSCLRGDINADGLIDGADIPRFAQILIDGGASPREKCAGDVESAPDFQIDVDDIDNFSNCLLAGGGC